MRSHRSLTLKILTPEGTLIEKADLDGITLPLANNYPIGVRPGHAPLIAETVQGAIKYHQAGETSSIMLYAGVVEIREDIVTVLTPGEVNKTAPVTATEKEYARLMRTLVRQATTVISGEGDPGD